MDTLTFANGVSFRLWDTDSTLWPYRLLRGGFRRAGLSVSELAPGTAFVNVGVWHGFTFLAGLVGNPDARCIGIDDFSAFGGPRDDFLARFEPFRGLAHSFHEGDYRDYFATVHGGTPIGFYLYDGDHSYENQLQGLEIAEPFLAPQALVLVDDTNLEAAWAATLDFIESRSGSYELVVDRRTAMNRHLTLWNGIMLFRRCG